MNKKHFLPFLFAVSIYTILTACCAKKPESKEDGSAISTVIIQKKGDSLYTLAFADLRATVDFKNGGRLESISLNEDESFLSGKKVNAGNWGTSLWPSPQSAWGWPPSQQLDNMTYTVIEDTNEVILKSHKDPKQAFIFIKAYKINTADTSLVVTYTILNDTTIAQKVAAWEISRVAPGGLTFYPSGSEVKRGQMAPLTKDSIGITWFKYDAATIPAGVPKLLADGKEGWLAQVNRGYVLVKKFHDVADGKYAPEEGEIELYANPDHTYIEIEQQGEYAELKAGESLTYTVIWKLRKLPAGTNEEVGNSELASFVRSLSK
jgi:hypothetical protein